MQFLRGDFKGKQSPLRPPWAIDESLFTEICTRCSECITHCPTHIIKPARANFPVIDFSAGECLFCEQCVEVCKPHALLKTTQKITPWSIKALIKKDICIAHQGVECRSCYDPCESRAIMMPPRPGRISIPVISKDTCTGCGACVSVCPVQAITTAQPQ
ncbi:MAG: ferredoxin-type protein NapF [Gammaproteobacteria bacterium]|nr:ferredoxin-type protein NapF [Gammaproteobacteria bacterium]